MQADLVVVSNSSPLINLAKTNQLHLLKRIYGSVTIAQAVYDEVVLQGSGRAGSHAVQQLVDEGTIQVKTVRNQTLITLLKTDLDVGESETIALALEMSANLVLLDEAEARKIAALYQLPRTGFLGILLKAQQLKLLDNAMAIIDEAVMKEFRISPVLYETLRRQEL